LANLAKANIRETEKMKELERESFQFTEAWSSSVERY